MNKTFKKYRAKIGFYTISTRLKYKERNAFLKYCRDKDLTPSEIIRNLIIKEMKGGIIKK